MPILILKILCLFPDSFSLEILPPTHGQTWMSFADEDRYVGQLPHLQSPTGQLLRWKEEAVLDQTATNQSITQI